jgi:polysaccharide biosynthesis/export protein
MSKWLLACSLLAVSCCQAQSNFFIADQPDRASSCEQPRGAGAQPDRCRPQESVPSMITEGQQNSSPAAVVPRPAPRPPLTRTEFEIFAEDASGTRLMTYGRDLFEDVPSTFAPVDRVPVPADYVLGPGDELLIRAWGKIELDAHATIDRDGQIALPRVGTLNVAGLHYSQVDGYLHAAIGALFKDFTLNVALGQLRSIQIYVLGHARRPGVYTVGSLSTLVNALFVSGGPSATGSMRQVKLIRNHQVLTEFDIYDLVKHGDKSRDQPLLPGDIVFIPPIGPQAAITGSVEEPGIYELKGETTVGSALALAGGLTSLAETRRVVLEQVEDQSRRMEEFALNGTGMERAVKNGDLLQVLPVSPQFINTVSLRGNVGQPGRYAWREGMRVRDLIPSRDFLLTREYWNRENHLVQPSGKHPFADPRTEQSRARGREEAPLPAESSNRSRPQNDQAYLAEAPGEGRATGNEPGAQQSESPEGEFLPSGDPADDAQQRGREVSETSDAAAGPDRQTGIDIVHSNTEINWHYASIERLDEHDLSPRLIAFQLDKAIDDAASSDNQLLRPGDVVTVFSRVDIPLPIEEHATFVRVGGEVRAPGVYRVNPGDTLRDAVRQAGGLTPHSYLYASQLLRVSTRRIQEEQLKRSTEQMQRELSASYANNALPNKEADQAQLSMRQALIARISSVVPNGRVVLEMRTDASTIEDIPDFTLEDGDSFYIPPRLSTIQVSGAVYNENAFRYQPNKLTTAYLADAGGATRDADTKRMFLVRADGTVISRQSRGRHRASFERTALLPGDAIVIPVKLNAGAGWRELEQITGILSQSAITAASLAVIQK